MARIRHVSHFTSRPDPGLGRARHVLQPQRKLAAAARGIGHGTADAASHVCQSGTATWSVRSTCNGVIDTHPCAVA